MAVKLSINEIWGAEGVLAKTLPGFFVRASQIALTTAIQETLDTKIPLVAEAGTGTGKTFSYLIPALQSSQKVFISTGTKNLQDQLFFRDLPFIRQALKHAGKVALLKGRQNYLCWYRYERHAEEDYDPNLATWAKETISGDLTQFNGITEASHTWPAITSTAENCLGNTCPHVQDCFLVKARKAAQAADLVVINHHLYFADLALKEDAFGEILPPADAVIFDEAHQLPEIATQFFGKRFSTRQLNALARDLQLEVKNSAADMEQLAEIPLKLVQVSDHLRYAFGTQLQRGAWNEVENRVSIKRGIEEVQECLDRSQQLLELASERSLGLRRALERVLHLRATLQIILENPDNNYIPWYEVHHHTLSLHASPLSIAEVFAEHLRISQRSMLFLSATLAVDGKFDHFTRQMGTTEARCHTFESPFDYAKQSVGYLPKGLPDPGDPDFTERVVQAAIPVIEASRGRCFFLFTSHRALQIAQHLLPRLISYPLLIQGQLSKAELLRRFTELGNAVLLGTYSFWEGVDVKGEALSCVIIDKIPFSAPNDPILKARSALAAKRGENAFFTEQLPQAVIQLKQGVGRLIRSEDDRGILMLCDPRFTNRGYSAAIMKSLPPIPWTREFKDVIEFFAEIPV